MPGAVVQVVDDNDFTGTIKIKLGPISLVYAGSGTYVERDEAGHRAEQGAARAADGDHARLEPA